ncbi:SNF-related serine/threonine-protein kinase-like isoform X2 [Mya arenaria]|uniref:SNF-related serine/threonine-protein kinase-like isoform X2 n=1 Tax=Mya arenaria TaxID=6604 RepID=UPI0022E9689C|nr:SNF-related serine/threonine-protein kinase-like isoform X2 [Mya arenaria]
MAHRRLRSDFDGKIAGLYDLEETIGEGHFAVVKLARHVFTGEKVAVKVIDKNKLDEVSKAHLFQEVRCMKLVQHPNVVRLYEVIDTQTKLYLILELGDGGDMYDYIMKHEKGIEENKARHYFSQIVEAISYCHRLHVVHRDLKPENVVFFKKLEVVKLTDFGFSNMFNPGNKLETSCGSLAYSAPEILLGDSYDAQAVDIWSLGVILFMLVCGEAPFQEASDSETLTMIMDCKYKFPPHVSQPCRNLISLMLRREPGQRGNLQQIEKHEWLRKGGDDVPHFHMPLISREQVSEEDHVSVIEKMVEGCIASKDEILMSIEKDMYNHITATYYLLAERRLRKHRQDMVNQAAMFQLRKHSAPPGSKPKLEPLALSPRKQREIKKTRTVPLNQDAAAQMLAIAESPSHDDADKDPQSGYFKSLTSSQTLDRRSKTKLQDLESGPGPICPKPVRPLNLMTRSVPEIQEPIRAKLKKPRNFNKIAILSSFFEQKIAQLAGNGASKKKKGKSWRILAFKKDRRVKMRGLPDISNLDTPANSSFEDCQQSKDAESADVFKHQFPKQKGLVMSLLSPQGIHPTPSTSLRDTSPATRKCSLIQEESVDEGDEEDEDADLEIDNYTELIRASKSVENLDIDENHSQNASPVREVRDREDQSTSMFVKRPLLSVASSPQLLNQICEENESEEDEDFVPPRLSLHSRVLTKRNSVASPEVIRKYEQRRKHRTSVGSRGTSCSSSDASDTDDTEGRSRKDKLKQKFIHRRDSSDHSSDTDGGPSGHGNGGFGRGLGGGGSGGNNGRGGDDKGDGGGKRDRKGGSPKSGHSHHGKGKQNHLSFKIGGDLIKAGSVGRISECSTVSNNSLSSLRSRSSLKYVIERDENISDSDAEDNADGENEGGDNELKKLRKSLLEKLNQENKMKSRLNKLEKGDSSVLKKSSTEDLNKLILARCSLSCSITGKENSGRGLKMDINSNMSCKQSCKVDPVKIETKCCSLV